MNPSQAKDLYQRLGIPKDSTPTEVKVAFKAQAFNWHPDRNPDNPLAQAEFVLVCEAYEILSDPTKRRGYDARTRPSETSTRRSETPARPPPSHTANSGVNDSYNYYSKHFAEDLEDILKKAYGKKGKEKISNIEELYTISSLFNKEDYLETIKEPLRDFNNYESLISDDLNYLKKNKKY